MSSSESVSRRAFLATTGAALAASAMPAWAAPAPGQRRRLALVGTGHRGTGMWGKDVVDRYGDVIEFVGLCDVNPLRVAAGKRLLGVACPTFTGFEEMLSATKPDTVVVTTVDATHTEFIVPALERGLSVITGTPMG